MKILGIESSCDECAAAVVEDGRTILSNVVASQIPFHAAYNGVVPEIASRKHTEWIYDVAKEALDAAGLAPKDIDAVAVTSRPGLLGSLLVGLSFAKAFAWARRVPFVAVDHMLAHLYAPRLVMGAALLPPPTTDAAQQQFQPHSAEPQSTDAPQQQQFQPHSAEPPPYPFLGLLVSGGHTIICRADDFDDITVLGTTIDDAVGEAFDKVAKHYGFGYPGGAVIDRMAQSGDSGAFRFPLPNLHKGSHRYDVSYSGLKTAVINQLETCKARPGAEARPEDIAASFQKTAVEILLRALFNAAEDTGLSTIVAGGGVAANSYLRARLAEYGVAAADSYLRASPAERGDGCCAASVDGGLAGHGFAAADSFLRARPAERGGLRCVFPSPELCGDNGAMVAGIGFHYLSRGEQSPLSITASARVNGFKKKYP